MGRNHNWMAFRIWMRMNIFRASWWEKVETNTTYFWIAIYCITFFRASWWKKEVELKATRLWKAIFCVRLLQMTASLNPFFFARSAQPRHHRNACFFPVPLLNTYTTHIPHQPLQPVTCKRTNDILVWLSQRSQKAWRRPGRGVNIIVQLQVAQIQERSTHNWLFSLKGRRM